MAGGGTAGWLSALTLQNTLTELRATFDLTVIESSKIPTIGVGEGTTGAFRGLLLALGLDEIDFLKQTEATIKFGIRHRDWRRIGMSYDGPIDDPATMFAREMRVSTSWPNQYCVARGRSVAEPHQFTALMRRSRSPFTRLCSGKYKLLPPFHFAYQFDQALVGSLSAQFGKRRPAHGRENLRRDQGILNRLG